MAKIVNRCFWANPKNPLYLKYHDKEWGIPLHQDKKLFEMLLLESFQAGLSWECVLNKREAFREAFDNFNAKKISAYDEAKVQELLANPGIIRNKLKVNAAINNAKIFLAMQKEFGSFDNYLWGFTNGEVIQEPCNLRTTSPLSDAISKDLKKRGMKFVGSTVIYSYLQAMGIIWGHLPECDCFRLTVLKAPKLQLK